MEKEKPVSPKKGKYDILRLSESDFIDVCMKLSFHVTTKKMLYEVVVNGKNQIEVAKDFNVTRQSVNKGLRVLKLAVLKKKKLPLNWKQTDLFFSPELMKKIKKLQEDEILNKN